MSDSNWVYAWIMENIRVDEGRLKVRVLGMWFTVAKQPY